MANAPVMYTLTQVRFNQVLNLEKFLPEIQDRIRTAGYPDFRQETVNAFVAPPIGSNLQSFVPQLQAVTRYFFANAEGTSAFILENNAMSFQATEYEVFEAFSQQFLLGLKIVHSAIQLAYYERVGVRYLDAVVPRHDEQLSDYLNSEVLGFKVAGKLTHSYTETVSQNGDVGLIARLLIQNGKVGLPLEISSPTALPLNERFTKVDGLHAVIDTDAFNESRQHFDIVNLAKILTSLHSEAVRAFKATVTPFALKVWE